MVSSFSPGFPPTVAILTSRVHDFVCGTYIFMYVFIESWGLARKILFANSYLKVGGEKICHWLSKTRCRVDAASEKTSSWRNPGRWSWHKTLCVLFFRHFICFKHTSFMSLHLLRAEASPKDLQCFFPRWKAKEKNNSQQGKALKYLAALSQTKEKEKRKQATKKTHLRTSDAISSWVAMATEERARWWMACPSNSRGLTTARCKGVFACLSRRCRRWWRTRPWRSRHQKKVSARRLLTVTTNENTTIWYWGD